MNRVECEKKEQLINHLIKKRDGVDRDHAGRPTPDSRDTYDYICDEIARLKMELFQVAYRDYEQNLNHVLGIGRNGK